MMESFAVFPQEFCHEAVILERFEQLDLRPTGIAILFEAECTFLYFFTQEKDASQYIPVEPGGLADAVYCMSGMIQFQNVFTKVFQPGHFISPRIRSRGKE